MTFVSNMTSALAWPFTILLIALMLRKHVLALLPMVSELTLPGGFAAKFNQQLDAIEKNVTPVAELYPAVEEPRVRYSVAAMTSLSETDELALKYNPTGVVMESWKEVEAAARDVLVQAKVKTLLTTPVMALELLMALRDNSLITQLEFDSLNELRRLRNRVAHESSARISPTAAERFKELADKFISKMRMRMNDRKNAA